MAAAEVKVMWNHTWHLRTPPSPPFSSSVSSSIRARLRFDSRVMTSFKTTSWWLLLSPGRKKKPHICRSCDGRQRRMFAHSRTDLRADNSPPLLKWNECTDVINYQRPWSHSLLITPSLCLITTPSSLQTLCLCLFKGIVQHFRWVFAADD